MGNDYYHQHHLHNKNTFLPMLCSKPSIKEVHLPRLKNLSSPSSSSSSLDPLSPRVGCMGQVKRNNNRVMVFPTTTHRFITPTTTKTNNNNMKYAKLKRLFSGRSLATPTNTSTNIGCTRKMIRDSCDHKNMDMNCRVPVNVADLDPPLPVIKKVHKPIDGGDGDSLWKRRSAGGALKTLQIQQISVPKQCLRPTTV